MNWSWPQFVMLFFVLIVYSSGYEAGREKYTSGINAFGGIFLAGVLCLVLHVGGFW